MRRVFSFHDWVRTMRWADHQRRVYETEGVVINPTHEFLGTLDDWAIVREFVVVNPRLVRAVKRSNHSVIVWFQNQTVTLNEIDDEHAVALASRFEALTNEQTTED